ncbi:hypothetical protein [Yersinia intermedia]|uniref:Uncharacterized protein n=1 Tax=Yersinia intermedia TaxID=631 RepID=A0A0T9MSQ9_YERIN|nr:hypothetical protein [Yersinia intermedia]CNG42604.1 Uncharacterised protein [Yersinia intermedia]
MNNLELSNPVAWTDADELADMDCNTYGNIFNAKYIDIHNGRWLPLYSQGYIDFLIAQLEAAQKERDDLKELNCHFDLSIRKTEGVNEVLRSKLEAAERALIKPLPIGELVHRLEGQTYEKWFSESDVKDLLERAQKAEAALSAANERVSQEYPETLPCPVRLEPGLRLGKGLPIAMLFRALSRRADYEAEIAAMTPEQRVEHDQRTREVKKFISECITPRPAGFTVEGE